MDSQPRKRKFEEHLLPKHASSAKILYSSLCYRGAGSCLAWSPQNMIAYAPSASLAHKSRPMGSNAKQKGRKTDPFVLSLLACSLPPLPMRIFRKPVFSALSAFVLATMYPSIQASALDSPSPANELLDDLVPAHEASQYHRNNCITHLAWNQRGTCLASIDETGQLALWESVHSIKNWGITHKLDIKEPVVAFLWLNTERVYVLSAPPSDRNLPSEDKYIREPFGGPRNPYGSLAFLVMTTNGEVSAYYQQGHDVFSKLSTTILSPTSADAFGRKCISHASFALNHDGSICLAVHWAKTIPKRVGLNKVILEFPKDGREGVLQCKTISTISLSQQLHDKTLALIYTAPIIHLKLLCSSRRYNVRVVVVVAEKIENSMHVEGTEDVEDHFESVLATWELKESSINIRNDFTDSLEGRHGFSTDPRPTLKFVEGFKEDKLITAVNTYGGNTELLLGFSDGTTLVEYRDNGRLGIAKAPPTDGSWIDAKGPPNFWKPMPPAEAATNCVMGLVTSPNETFFMSLTTSRDCILTSMAESPLGDDLVPTMSRLFALCLHNNRDYSDLLLPTTSFSKLRKQKDLCELLIQRVIGSSLRTLAPSYLSAEPPSSLSVAIVGPLYALMLSLFRVFKKKNIQYMNAYASLHVHSIAETMLGCCVSSEKEIMEKFESGGKSSKVLKFDVECLWSLIPLTAWMLDFTAFLMRDLSIFFNERKRVNVSELKLGISSPKQPPLKSVRAATASHIVLLLYRVTREHIAKNLILTQQLQAYLKELSSRADAGRGVAFINLYMGNLIKGCPVPLDTMLQVLDEIGKVSDGVTKGAEAGSEQKRFDLIMNVHPVVPAKYEKVLDQIEVIVKSQSAVLRSFDLYALDTDWLGLSLVEDGRLQGPLAKQLSMDVVRKSSLSKSGMLRQCMRCWHFSVLPKEGQLTDHSSRTAWWHSTRCVCGGFWK